MKLIKKKVKVFLRIIRGGRIIRDRILIAEAKLKYTNKEIDELTQDDYKYRFIFHNDYRIKGFLEAVIAIVVNENFLFKFAVGKKIVDTDMVRIMNVSEEKGEIDLLVNTEYLTIY